MNEHKTQATAPRSSGVDSLVSQTMTLAEALHIIGHHAPTDTSPPISMYLACGITPLHLETFLKAYLAKLFPSKPVVVNSGLYGDITGNLQRGINSPGNSIFLLAEWQDLDPRLGIRAQGYWPPRTENDILKGVQRVLTHLATLIAEKPYRDIVICPPTLPIPPVSYQPCWQSSSFSNQLQHHISDFLSAALENPKAKCLNLDYLNSLAPLRSRHDIRSNLKFGYPFTVKYTAILTNIVVRLMYPPSPLKGLITDLDNTLWRGIAGENGPRHLSWDLDHNSQMHALYQLTLQSLADSGVLIAAASRADQTTAAEALKRTDLLVDPNAIFPIEANWGAKSESVSRILKTWNIHEEAVAFIDDSPAEVAEVLTHFPGMNGITFPTRESEIYDLLHHLRNIFGKAQIVQEDMLRAASIKASTSYRAEKNGNESTHTLADNEAAVSVQPLTPQCEDPRALELINKTNQFNLNGTRYTSSEWNQLRSQTNRFVLLISYRDKFGPLGKISVISGVRNDRSATIDVWVMSCRAFARQVEHQCLSFLFSSMKLEALGFDYKKTDRNDPFKRFLEHYSPCPTAKLWTITGQVFSEKSPALEYPVERSQHE